MEAKLNQEEIKLIENKLNQLPIFTLSIVNEIVEIIQKAAIRTNSESNVSNIEDNKEL